MISGATSSSRPLCTFSFGILIHLMLHWNWVCSVIATQILTDRERPDEGMQTIYGVATLIVLLHLVGAGIVVALFFVHGRRRRLDHCQVASHPGQGPPDAARSFGVGSDNEPYVRLPRQHVHPSLTRAHESRTTPEDRQPGTIRSL